jgi:preprotein translocase YajC subunit
MKNKLTRFTAFVVTTGLIHAPAVFALGAKPPADPNAPPPPAWVSFMPMLVMIAVFYFLLIRPQMKQKNDRQKMIDSLKKGDKIVTQGGIIATVVNIFLRSEAMMWVTTYIGLFVFVGLTAYDTQRIKNMNMSDSEEGHKMAILGALTLYLDFVNMFLYLLRLTGKRR